MGSVVGDEPMQLDGLEEKIFVSVRLRPLNEKEISRNDLSIWECINDTTVIFKNSLPERSILPTAYTFDRVFRAESSTKQVYEEGAKEVALSVISGINASIFAYGQTSSGKTYTMCGITEYAVEDIYDYIHRHNDRDFVLKFSAMEIYNESVRDLLSMDSTPLRLLDDPERGTVIERLTEETLRDSSHLQELLSICEAQRQIGETSLNEVSSRSHQILRLTIESSAREVLDAEKSSTLTATVNFVDLAGSERASQTLSAGARLKEGCHINRSLLTLGTVIRKLSKGKNGHVPYRDSKLTRILQNSLGGNARTAIICTMCPAHSHVEQSRNTLLFASCAKEVSTNAQVNVVMSEKALVKQLQRELSRLEAELRNLGSTSSTSDSAALLKQKEVLIEKMDKEIKELTQQRDIAQSRIEDLIRSAGEYQFSRTWPEPKHLLDPWLCEYSPSESSEVVDALRSDVASSTSRLSDSVDDHISNKHDLQLPKNSEDNFLFDNNSPRLLINKFFGPDHEDSEDQCKEVRCIEMEEPNIERNTRSDSIASPSKEDRDISHTYSDQTYEALKQKIKDMQKTIDCLENPYPVEQSPSSSEADMSGSRSVSLSRSRSCKAILTTTQLPPWFDRLEKNENKSANGSEEFHGRPEGCEPKLSESDFGANNGELCSKDSQISVGNDSTDKKEKNSEVSGEGDSASVHVCESRLHEVVKSNSQKQFVDNMNQEAEAKTDESEKNEKGDGLEKVEDSQQSPSNWPLEFEKQRREIIELWDACSVPLIHRTYFFLLFKGDPSDYVYMEVELRRLSFLKNTLSLGNRTVKDGQILTSALSKKVLYREKEVLARQILKRFLAKEREVLYQKWGIGLNTKQRRLQLIRKLWTDTKDMDHIKESAALVAKLVGFAETGQTPKEMFGLSFSVRPMNLRSFSWKPNKSSLM